MSTQKTSNIRLEANEFIAISYILGPERTRYIAKAVTNHDALLEAAEAAQEGVHNLTCLTSPIGNKGHYPLCNLLRAAVADARRTT